MEFTSFGIIAKSRQIPCLPANLNILNFSAIQENPFFLPVGSSKVKHTLRKTVIKEDRNYFIVIQIDISNTLSDALTLIRSRSQNVLALSHPCVITSNEPVSSQLFKGRVMNLSVAKDPGKRMTGVEIVVRK